ncbi:MAG: hypothetical protein ACREQR_01205 [Candidatus Binataceae bacterium]
MPDLSDPAVLKLTHQILARPEYAAATTSNTRAAWERWILQWLEKLQFLHDSSPILYWVIFAAVIAVAILLFAHIAWSIWVAMHTAAPREARIARPSAPDLSADAAGLASDGHYLEAAHRLMLASYRMLGERSVIELRPDRSNRWIRAALRGSSLDGELAADLDSLVERTERRWFGDRENDSAIYAQWRAAFERLSSVAR